MGVRAEFNYIMYKTACQCTRMVPVTPTWLPVPEIRIPLLFPPEVMDWIQKEPRDDQVFTTTGIRRFRLEREDLLGDGRTMIWTYVEMRG